MLGRYINDKIEGLGDSENDCIEKVRSDFWQLLLNGRFFDKFSVEII